MQQTLIVFRVHEFEAVIEARITSPNVQELLANTGCHVSWHVKLVFTLSSVAQTVMVHLFDTFHAQQALAGMGSAPAFRRGQKIKIEPIPYFRYYLVQKCE